MTGKASDIAQPGGFRRDHVIANLPVGDTVVPTYVQKSFLTSIGATGLLQSAYCGFVNDTLHLGDEQSESEELIPLFNSLDTIHAVKSETSPRGASVKKTIFTIFKSFIGSGILFLPKGFQNGGMLFSIVGLCVSAALSTFCMLRLVECSSVLLRSRNHHNISYGIVGEKAFGNLGRRAVNVSLVLSQIGFCCSYLIFVEKNIGEVLLHAFNVGSSTTTSSWTLILLQIPLYTPLAWVRRLEYFAATSLFADVLIVFGLVYILTYILSYPLMLYPVINVLESNLFPYQRIKGFWRWKKNAFRFALVCLTAVIGYFGKDERLKFDQSSPTSGAPKANEAMDPRSTYMELAALDKQLRDLLRANPLDLQAANALRRRLTDAATRLVDAQPAFAAAKEVEQALWKPCFYRRIEDFRRRIRKYAAAAQADRNVREHFARVSSEFQQFLTEAAGFYAHLRDVFASWLQHNGQGAKDEDVTRCRQSLHRCYVFLGDLARYRELHSQKTKKNFAAAEALYHRALAVLPENGNPHNQLAVLATYVEAETVAVYRYCRSLLTSQPFTTAEENLALLFERSRQRPLAAPITFTSSSPSSKEKSAFLKSYLHRLTRMHGILFALSSQRGSPTASSGRGSSSEAVTPVYPRDMEAVLFKDMRTLLHAGVVGDALLLKIVVTNLFSIIRASDSRLQSAPLEDALRLSIRTITSVMEFLLDSLDIKPNAGANGKAPKDSALLALRLAGPVTVFCDYLKLHPDMLEQLEQLLVHRQKKLYSDVATNDQGAEADQFASTFLATLAKLVNHARIRELYAPLVASVNQQYANEAPSAVREQQSLLKESLELRGFAPLEQAGTASTWQTSSTGANSAPQVAPLADDEAEKIRAWKLYHFARYLCDGYEGDPLLFCGASGQFTTSPVVGNGGSQQNNGTTETFGSFNLGALSSNNPKNQLQQQTHPQGNFASAYRADTGVDDDDNFDDEVIVFQPSPALRGMTGNQPAKQHGGLMAHESSALDTLSSGGAFSLRAPSPISPAEEHASANSLNTAFGAVGNGSIGSSLGYPSFNTFNDAGNFSSQSLLSGWGNSTSNITNGSMLSENLGLGMRFGSNSSLEAGFTMPYGEANGAQPPSFGNRLGQSQPFAPMIDLAAVERESALYQQRTSSLSAFMGSSAPSTQTETQDPSPPRMPKRPPPGFGTASIGGGQQRL
uniref:Amino acid transporter transmembrane domain-containing protein n=2 Tax=Phytophthora ramorum TaxID=164328 RepID=H3GRP2_PHYRM